MRREPAITAAIAQVIALLAARYGLELDTDATLALAVLLSALLAVAVRQLVTPTKGES